MPLRALIFDVDGTLADTERDGHRVAFNRAFADAGLAWNWTVPVYGELLAVTGGKERIRHYAETICGDPIDQATVETLHRLKTGHYMELLDSEGIPLRSGVARLLREARDSSLQLAIATTTTPVNVEALLRTSFAREDADAFEVIGAGDIVSKKKPAPDIYHHVLAALGVDAADAVAIEDSENGLRAARAAGLITVITTNDYTVQQDFSGAALVVPELGDEPAPAGHPVVTVNVLRHLLA